MRTLFATLLLTLAMIPLASADGCTTTSSTETIGTLTIDQYDQDCSFTYFGTGYYANDQWSNNQTVITESTTGARIASYSYDNENEYASQWYGSGSSTGDQRVVGVEIAGQAAGVGVSDSQETNSGYGCYGGSSLSVGTYSSDGETNVYRNVYRGDTRTAPCVPQDLREML